MESYNYLNDAIGINFSKASDYKICNKEKVCLIKATICGKCYRDPDRYSSRLYEDMSKKFELKSIKRKGKLYLTYKETDEQDNNYDFSTDYIGPSRYWALKFLGGDVSKIANTIGDFLSVTRTIGGHVFWPAHKVDNKNTINQARGGNGMYDRFDITLAELKHYFKIRIECYESKNDSYLFYEPLYDAFKRYDWFFRKYKNFNNFIKYMKLDMFLYEDEVINLVNTNIEDENYEILKYEKNENINNNFFKPKDYENYIKNCKILILKRTKSIEK